MKAHCSERGSFRSRAVRDLDPASSPRDAACLDPADIAAFLTHRGRDGRGTGGLAGYFLSVHDLDPKLFATLVRRLPAWQLEAVGAIAETNGTRTVHIGLETAAELLARQLDPGCIVRAAAS
jgi:hypothetical protein